MQGNSITDFVYTYETQYAHQFNHIVREKKIIIWLYSTLTGGFTHIHQQRHLFHYSQTTRVLPFSIFIFSAVQALRVVFFCCFFSLLLLNAHNLLLSQGAKKLKRVRVGRMNCNLRPGAVVDLPVLFRRAFCYAKTKQDSLLYGSSHLPSGVLVC